MALYYLTTKTFMQVSISDVVPDWMSTLPIESLIPLYIGILVLMLAIPPSVAWVVSNRDISVTRDAMHRALFSVLLGISILGAIVAPFIWLWAIAAAVVDGVNARGSEPAQKRAAVLSIVRR